MCISTCQLSYLFDLPGGSKKGSQVSYVRQVPKFLQAHAHLLGKGAKAGLAGPEGATMVQDVDSDAEADFEHDDGVKLVIGTPPTMPSLCSIRCHCVNFMSWPSSQLTLQARRLTNMSNTTVQRVRSHSMPFWRFYLTMHTWTLHCQIQRICPAAVC